MLKKLAALGGVACASIITGVYALSSFNNNRYKNKIPSYRKTFEEVEKWRSGNDSIDLLLKNPEDTKWWSERGTEFKQFYKGDWQDFRDKCFSEIKSSEEELNSTFGNSASFYSKASDVIMSSEFKFASLCVYRQSNNQQ